MAGKRVFYLIAVLVFPSVLRAQPEATSGSTHVYEIAFDSALAKLNYRQLAVYTGRAYYPYFIKKTGIYSATTVTTAGSRPGEHPFYLIDEFRSEVIEFDGVVYPAINLAFDICRSEVVVLTPQRNAIVLPSGRVQKFQYAGHSFQALTHVNGLKPDFYDILYWTDNASLIAKRRKNQNELWRTISDYYIVLNSQANPIGVYSAKTVGIKAAVLEILGDQKDAMRSFIRESKLKFTKKKKEQSLIKIVEYYTSLK